ncbi:sensor histidine kinase [Candidatus Woesearchaeota archaeon]|nr:sensor histidine kinase [Candidatus Woesearchaeota archaeon]
MSTQLSQFARFVAEAQVELAAKRVRLAQSIATNLLGRDITQYQPVLPTQPILLAPREDITTLLQNPLYVLSALQPGGRLSRWAPRSDLVHKFTHDLQNPLRTTANFAGFIIDDYLSDVELNLTLGMLYTTIADVGSFDTPTFRESLDILVREGYQPREIIAVAAKNLQDKAEHIYGLLTAGQFNPEELLLIEAYGGNIVEPFLRTVEHLGLEDSENHILRLEKASDDILTVARKVGLDLTEEHVNLGKYFTQQATVLATLGIRVHYCAQTPLLTLTNPAVVDALNNWVGNVAKYASPQATGKESTELHVRVVYDNNGHAHLELRDTGNGIDTTNLWKRAVKHGYVPAEQTPNPGFVLSDLIYRSGITTSDNPTGQNQHGLGAGLGMGIIRDEVQQIGGNFSVQSETGNGTTATMRLPPHAYITILPQP